MKKFMDVLIKEMGKPLLVAYQFKHELERILKRFPQAQAFAKGAKGNKQMEAWNRGEIDILCVHPASAGHGLNFRNGERAIRIWRTVEFDSSGRKVPGWWLCMELPSGRILSYPGIVSALIWPLPSSST